MTCPSWANTIFVFQETGIVSRDKLLSSGQTGKVTGHIVGIYLFRADDGDAAAAASGTGALS